MEFDSDKLLDDFINKYDLCLTWKEKKLLHMAIIKGMLFIMERQEKVK